MGPLDEDLRKEARAVARALMRRIRANVALITERLETLGYPFCTEYEPAHSPPEALVGSRLKKLRRIAGGPPPASLSAFWREVGGVHWRASEDHLSEADCGSGLRLGELDPLCISSVEVSWYSVENWLEMREDEHPEAVGPLYIELSADYVHKAGCSGGPPYAMQVPNEAADGVLEFEVSDLPLVEYLRLCFEWGGFPRARFAKSMSKKSRDFIDGLKRGLEPF